VDAERKPEGREEEIKDLDIPKDEAEDVKGGRKAGKPQQEYYEVKLQDVQISSYNISP
jgi:hypothetical protein